jgi:hypothetical protein
VDRHTHEELRQPTPKTRTAAWPIAFAQKKGQPERAALCFSIGAGERSRTPDLRITNALLYQLSYAGSKELKIIRSRLDAVRDALRRRTAHTKLRSTA